MKKLFLCFLFQSLFIQNALHAFLGFYDPIRPPKIGECYPNDPFSKKYIHSEKKLLYVRKVFTCEYVCINADQSYQLVIGTSDKKDWLTEDGRSFVCEGYAENMEFIETPNNPDSWGYWSLRGSSPFYPMQRKIPELKQWFIENFKNPSQEMLFPSPMSSPYCDSQDC